jgi:hypothetical protein
MLHDLLATLDYPWLLALAALLGLFAVPALVRFYYGSTYAEVARELDVDTSLGRQIWVARLLVYGGPFSLRAAVFVASYAAICGALYLLMAGAVRALA